jgi:hypothetical protein
MRSCATDSALAGATKIIVRQVDGAQIGLAGGARQMHCSGPRD